MSLLIFELPNIHNASVFCLPQYPYSRAISLYLTTKGKGMDNIVFLVADQIKHSIGNLAD